MGNFNLPLNSGLSIASVLDESPEGFKSYLRDGFYSLASIDEARYPAFAEQLTKSINLTDATSIADLAETLSVPIADAGAVGAALTTVAGFITNGVEVNDLISAFLERDIVTKQSSPRIEALSREIEKHKIALTALSEQTILANAVAPSYQRLECAPELRFAFENSEITQTVPVVICHLTTDIRTHSCTFQMKKSDVQQLIKQLQRIEGQLTAIENWAGGAR